MRTLREESKQPLHVPLTLLSILVIAFLLRLPGLNRDLWYDETWSLFNARGADVVPRMIPNGPEFTSELFNRDGGWRGIFVAVGHSEATPPLYFILLRLWIEAVGESNRSLRSLSIMFGMASLLVIYLLGRKAFDEKIGLAAAAWLAVLPVHIQYSQEVRAYALVGLLVMLASWAFWSAFQKIHRRDEWKYWTLYAGLAAACLYTHPFAASMLVAHGVLALVQTPARRAALIQRLLLSVVVALLLVSPWLVSPYFQSQLQRLPLIPTFWSLETPKRLVVMPAYFVAGYLPGMRFKSALGLMALGSYAISAIILRAAWRAGEKRSALLFSLFLFIVPIMTTIAVAAITDAPGLIAVPRFALPALTGLCLLFGVAVVSSPWRLVALLIVVTGVGLSLNFQVKWHQVNQSSSSHLGFQWAYGDVSPAVEKVNRQANPGELILFDDVYLPAVWNAHNRSSVPQLLMSQRWFLHFNAPMSFDERWREVERKYAGIYLIRRAEEPPSEVINRLGASYRLTHHERIGRLEIRHYQKPEKGRWHRGSPPGVPVSGPSEGPHNRPTYRDHFS